MASDPRAAIEARIPHRAPFLFVDRIVEEGEGRILTEWRVPEDLDAFRGHYPGNPVLPGVLISELCFQSAALLFSGPGQPADQDGVPVLTKIEDARYKRIVRPGETLSASLTETDRLGPARWVRGEVRCEGELVLRIAFVVAFVVALTEASDA